MKGTHIFCCISLAASLIAMTGSKLVAQDVVADSAGILVGAIRWDWTGGGTVNEAVERSLGPKEWHYRVPFFGKILNDSTIEASCASQACMDQEILYAKENGLDYWAFLLYPEGSDLDLPLRNYLSSAYNPFLKFCVIGDKPVDRLVQYFKHPSYQTVQGNRPLYYILFGETEEGHVADLRAACVAEGIPDPYVVHMKVDQEDSLGEDALSRYWYGGDQFGGSTTGAPYSALAAAARGDWQARLDAGHEQVPLVSAGTDGRPRIENTPPWTGDPSFYEKYFEPPTPAELAASLQEAVNFVAAHPENCASRAILIYSWNENDEGGWLTPTLDTLNPSLIDDSRLRAIKEVVAPTDTSRAEARDASLSMLLVNGDSLPDFHPDSLHYAVSIQVGHTFPPLINGFTRHPYARLTMYLAEDEENATIRVISEDGTMERSYVLRFSQSRIPAAMINWEFNTPNDSEGWTSRWSGHASLGVPDTVLRVDVTGDYPDIRSPGGLDIKAATYDRISIRMKNNTASNDWYFHLPLPDGESHYLDFTPFTSDTEFKEYTLDLSGMEAWKGTIDQISWLMARMAGSGSVEVDYIRLLRTTDSLSDDARLDALLVNGQALENFHPDLFSYLFPLPPGWTRIPHIEASAIHPGASVIIAQADSLNGEASIRVFSQSGLQSSRYRIRFEVPPCPRVPLFYSDFTAPDLPEDWAARQNGYRATVAEGAFHLEIPGEAAGMPYGLGGLYVQDFDLRPYVTIQYQAPKAMEVAVQLHGPDGTLSDSETFVLPASEGWTSHTFNLSALACESWGYHLDSIHLSFTSPTKAYPLRFLMDEILVGDSANGKTFQLEIHQPDPFTVDLGADTSLHSGETLFLDAGPALSYWWSTGDSTRSILADSAGTYVVQVSDERHCLAADTIRLDWISGWIQADQPLASSLCLYPNPAQEQCFLELPQSYQGQAALLRICKTNGSTLYQQEVKGMKSGSHLALDLRSFPEGVYLVSLQYLDDLQEGVLSSRLLIQRH